MDGAPCAALNPLCSLFMTGGTYDERDSGVLLQWARQGTRLLHGLFYINEERRHALGSG